MENKNEESVFSFGELVRIKCENKILNNKIGTLLLDESQEGPVYGTCVMIDGSVYGFERHEVEKIDSEFLSLHS